MFFLNQKNRIVLFKSDFKNLNQIFFYFYDFMYRGAKGGHLTLAIFNFKEFF